MMIFLRLNMDTTMKQRFRQPFGFYIENLIGKHLSIDGTFTVYHAHSHAFEWFTELADEDFKQLESLVGILDIEVEPLKKRVMEIIRSKDNFAGQGYLEVLKKAFSSSDMGNMFNKKILMLAISNIVSSNGLELLRIHDHKLIVSEIKSQYGPIVDYKNEINSHQVKTLLKLNSTGINTSLIYAIALPDPMFIEIPIEDIFEEFNKFDGFNGREFTNYDWSAIRIKIPEQYRNAGKFTRIDRSLCNFKDEPTLFKSIIDALPGKFPRLEKLAL